MRSTAEVPVTYCNDPDADNYFADASECDVEDNSICLYTGCTNPNACNFEGLSFQDGGLYADDGSCCIGNCLSFQLIDTYGDGWNGGTYTISDVMGNVLLTGTATDANQVNVQSIDLIEDICISNDCIRLSISGSTFPQEIGMIIESPDGVIFVYNPDPSAQGTGEIVDQIIEVGGLGSCSSPGCNDPLALNYSGDLFDCSGIIGGTDDSCCIYEEAAPTCDASIPLMANEPMSFNYPSQSTPEGFGCVENLQTSWFQYTATCSQTYSIMVSSDVQPKFSIYEGDCQSLVQVDCYDTAGQDEASLDVQLEIGVTYYIAIGIDPSLADPDVEGQIIIQGDLCAGCTYSFAENYNPNAQVDDGSCYINQSSCLSDIDGNGIVTAADLTILLIEFGNTCE